MAYNPKHKLRENIEALRVAFALLGGRQPEAGDLAKLQAYSGFGGIKAILYLDIEDKNWKNLGASKSDLELFDDITQLKQLLEGNLSGKEYNEAIQSLKNSVLTSFYTPDIVPKVLYETLKAQGVNPTKLYEPSSGAGIFISEAVKAFPQLHAATAVEKDVLTGKVLEALAPNLGVPSKIQVTGFENTPNEENGKFDLVVSNIPFGNFRVYDPAYQNSELTSKIHNYFFAKGLDKLGHGGLMAYITTDAFLNNPSNKAARQHLFERADFVSLSVMPDNLMKDTGNTEAPSHLLVVQKNDNKEGLSAEEKQLLGTVNKSNEFGEFSLNEFIVSHPSRIVGNEVGPGKNQYGKANISVWQTGNIGNIGDTLSALLKTDFQERLNVKAFHSLGEQLVKGASQQQVSDAPKLTYVPAPEKRQTQESIQLGLFDAMPAEKTNRAMDYLNSLDATVIQKQSVKMLGVIRTADNPEHEGIVLLTARALNNSKYHYKLYSNLKEITFSANWMNAAVLPYRLQNLTRELRQYGHEYLFEGEPQLKEAFRNILDKPMAFQVSKPFHVAGALVMNEGKPGRLEASGSPDGTMNVVPLVDGERHRDFYQKYIELRDAYLDKNQGEEKPDGYLDTIGKAYDEFTKSFGQLNQKENAARIKEDLAHGLIMLSSLERREGSLFVKSDVFNRQESIQENTFSTDDPAIALAQSLNRYGEVNLSFIGAVLAKDVEEIPLLLRHKIYLNPDSRKWEPADKSCPGMCWKNYGRQKRPLQTIPRTNT
ncbi:Eco57I restriction-modification methylase domain-containing protein [Fontibacter flavus]|uniref:Eco57I restriction-modification methylase domain-containing protein n=1 Tax=Fontibacter flavus TaxID=654838 RepID=A0ABV6FV24_9BACT